MVEHDSTALEDLMAASSYGWKRWLRKASNRAAYKEARRLSEDIRRLPPPNEPTDEELWQDALKTSAWEQKSVEISGRLRVAQARSERPQFAVAAIAILLACAALVVTAVSYFAPDSPVYWTGTGMQREMLLADGSRMTLGADSAVRVLLAANSRDIVLERGEARFQVHHETRRPFIVHVAGGSIVALGTEFVVRRYSKSNHVNVWVTEGAVEVAPDHTIGSDSAASLSGAHGVPVRLLSGQQVSYDARGHLTAARAADTEVANNLLRGSFIYRGQPLAEVIEDVQRYSKREINIDASAGELLYSGFVLLQHGDVEQWLRGLPAIYPELGVEYRPEQIQIHSRARSLDVEAPQQPTTH